MLRVLTAEFSHETNTFSVLPTTLESFESQVYICDASQIEMQRRGTRTTLGATYEAADLYNWNLTNTVCATSNPSGKVTNEIWEHIVGLILEPLLDKNGGRGRRSFDGIFLHLHGAMVTESYEDAEGELLRRIRLVIGDDIPIVVTLDLHGNITDLMAKHASSLIAVRTYPHIDFYERAVQGAALLQKAMTKAIKPVTLIAKRPMLRGLDGGKTHPGSPMAELIRRGELLEASGDILVFSICAGFTAADIYDIGPSVTITYDALRGTGSESKGEITARRVAEEFMDFAWETRHYISSKHCTVQEAVEKAKTAANDEALMHRSINTSPSSSHVPISLVMADVTDNPGSGHYGDATNLLRGLIEAAVVNAVFYAIYDPQAVQEGIKIGVGNYGNIALGGKFDPSAGGAPLVLYGKIVTLTDGHFPAYGSMCGGVWQNYGLSMLFRVAGVDIAVVSNNGQLLDVSQLISLGVDCRYKSVIAVKSNHHFRAALTSVAREIITVDGGGLGSKILKGGVYCNVRRPIWPIDDINIDGPDGL